MGREKEYRNVAEKQKAYRERKAKQAQDAQLAIEMLELLHSKIPVVQMYLRSKPPECRVVQVENNLSYATIYNRIGGVGVSMANPFVCVYMVRLGMLEFVSDGIASKWYRLIE